MFENMLKERFLPINFTEIYRKNHHTADNDEIHYIKDGVRVVCIKTELDEYFYFSKTIFRKNDTLTIISEKYSFDSGANYFNSNFERFKKYKICQKINE